MSQDYRERGFWRGGSGSETGYWSRVRDEDSQEGRHVGEGTGMREWEYESMREWEYERMGGIKV